MNWPKICALPGVRRTRWEILILRLLLDVLGLGSESSKRGWRMELRSRLIRGGGYSKAMKNTDTEAIANIDTYASEYTQRCASPSELPRMPGGGTEIKYRYRGAILRENLFPRDRERVRVRRAPPERSGPRQKGDTPGGAQLLVIAAQSINVVFGLLSLPSKRPFASPVVEFIAQRVDSPGQRCV